MQVFHPREIIDRRALAEDLARHAVEAGNEARRAYLIWYESFHYLWKLHGKTAPISGGEYDFDALCKRGKGVAGTPQKVAAFMRQRLLDSGANYPIVRFGFGDLTLAESVRSVELFMGKVVPGLVDLDARDGAISAMPRRAAAA